MSRPSARDDADKELLALSLHELRGPVAVLLAQAQTSQSKDPDAILLARSMAEEAQRLRVVIEGLGAVLNRAAPTHMDVTSLVQRTVSACAPVARVVGAKFAVDVSSPFTIRGDEGLLKAMLAQALLDAVGQAPVSTNVRISVSAEGTHCALEVTGQPARAAGRMTQAIATLHGGAAAVRDGAIRILLPLA